MINFILNDTVFEIIIGLLLLMNLFLTTIINYKQKKTKLNTMPTLNSVEKCKIHILFLAMVILFVYSYIKYNVTFSWLVYFIIPSIILIKSFYNILKKCQTLSTETKYFKLWSEIIFIIFCSSYAPTVYYGFCSNINHTVKELLLISYLLIKIMLFLFFLFENLTILISNIIILKPITLKKKPSNSISPKLKDYDFLLYNKFNSKTFYIIDIIIYSFLAVPTIILNLVVIVFQLTICFLKNKINIILHIVDDLNNDSHKVTKKITSISIIVSISIVYISILTDKAFPINQAIIDVYNYISTVILIPLIYDYIKNFSKYH